MTAKTKKNFAITALEVQAALATPLATRPTYQPRWRNDCISVFRDTSFIPVDVCGELRLSSWTTYSEAAYFIYGKLTQVSNSTSSGWTCR